MQDSEAIIVHRELLTKLDHIMSDHEKRIRWLERGFTMACGVGIFIKFIMERH